MSVLAPFDQWPVQNPALYSLYQRIAEGRVPHALLFIGWRAATGHLSEFLAKTLLCTGEAAPCGRCESCRQFAAGSHPDYTVIDGGEDGIRTGHVEALQQQLMVRGHGRRIVYVLREIDLATPVAANRLLKTLEEPAAPIIAILTTAYPERVLATIRSRCFAFPAVSEAEAAQDPWPAALASAGQDGETFATLLPRVIQWTQAWLDREEPALLLAERLQNMTADVSEEDAWPQVLWMLSAWWQDILHTKAGQGPIRFADHHGTLQRQAESADLGQLTQGIQLLLDAQTRLRSHVAAALNAEQLCIRLRRLRP
ncbi:ATP-binding protein [Alicyclobacillus herbarius]|uniref:DNA polymerase III subunit n=1 Tax=Alicyclobacillus herbarius TaxID=122960 RepID=UPI000429007D|nr:hypothetical protein [Alicyclobacillus herbarius]